MNKKKDQETTNQTKEMDTYVLVMPAMRYGHTNIILYAFNVGEDISYVEPKTYKE